MILENLDTQTVYDAYISALKWYRDLFSDTYKNNLLPSIFHKMLG